jgi:hypothetical protein
MLDGRWLGETATTSIQIWTHQTPSSTYKHSFGLAFTMADVQYLSNQLEGVSVQDENYDTHAPPVPLKAKVC